MQRFEDQPLLDVHNALLAAVDDIAAGEKLLFETCRPEWKVGRQEGTRVTVNGRTVRVRSLRCWVDLSESLGCRMLTPEPLDDYFMRVTFQKLDRSVSWHGVEPAEHSEKYGVDSRFSEIDKREDASYLAGFIRAFDRVALQEGARVLDLGVNTGDEFALIRRLLGENKFATMSFEGIDHSASAIEHAGDRFKEANVRFHRDDINRIDQLGLGRYHLILSIGTLHSPGIDAKRVLRSLVQNHLTDNGAVMLGLPNCRYVDGEVIYGAKLKNYSEHEISLLIKEIYFIKKYLQQHKFTVTMFGKHYLLIVGTRSLQLR